MEIVIFATLGILLMVYIFWALSPSKNYFQNITNELIDKEYVIIKNQSITGTNLRRSGIEKSWDKQDVIITKFSIIFPKISYGTQVYLKNQNVKKLKSVENFIDVNEIVICEDKKGIKFVFRPPNTSFGELYMWKLNGILENNQIKKLLNLERTK